MSGELDDRSDETRRLILNPTSGRGDHVDRARRLAAEHGFAVEETDHAGHAAELARRAAADSVDLLGVCGGDGTLHETVQGLYAADALDSVTLCIVPGGTENIVARTLGVRDMAGGFEVGVRGETRRFDLGIADDEPFVMSAIAGLPADVSALATHELKQRYGSLAFVIGAVQEASEFDGLAVEVDGIVDGERISWTGEALAVLVGNLRRFTGFGGHADAEDGLLEVTIVEQMPPGGALAEAIERQILQKESPHVTELRTPHLDVVGLDDDPVTFSLDGEIRSYESIRLAVVPRTLRLRVGDAYDP